MIDELDTQEDKTQQDTDDYQLNCPCWFKKHNETYALMVIGFTMFTIFLLLANLSGHRPHNHWRNIKKVTDQDPLEIIKTNITL